MTTTAHPLRARPFPIQRGEPITWGQAEWGYRCYAAMVGTLQSLERLAERGGFGAGEIRLYAQDVVRNAPRRLAVMRRNVHGLPRGERLPEVEPDLAARVEEALG